MMSVVASPVVPVLLKTPSPTIIFSSSPSSSCVSLSSLTLTQTPLSKLSSPVSICSSQHQHQHQFPLHHQQFQEEEDDEIAIGDCLVFEQGIFQDPLLEQQQHHHQGFGGFHSNNNNNTYKKKPSSSSSNNNNNNISNKKESKVKVEPQNLVPDEWQQALAAVNITKKERRKIARQAEFGRKLERNKQGLIPISNLDLEKEYVTYRDAKLSQLKPLVLDNPTSFPTQTHNATNYAGNGRVNPRNPRLEVYGVSLDNVSQFLNSGDYDPPASASSQISRGPRKLFTKEEKILLNKRVPDLADATSGKWQPLHTLAASGEFYLLVALIKHNVDINVPDKDGLTALHKATLGKKQAIFNILLRESANPFIRDKEGATLMHYAVRTASSQMIKILLLYNVDINLQDSYGWTPLHLAVQSRRTDIVRLLLVKGADKTLKNRDGLTALDLCLYSGRDTRTYEMIRLIKLLPKRRRLSDSNPDPSV